MSQIDALPPGTVHDDAHQGDTVYLSLPASHKYLHLLSGCISGMLERVDGLVDASEVTYNIQLAAHEIGSNIVEHAYASRRDDPRARLDITLTLNNVDLLLTVELRDQGQPFDPSVVPEPLLGEPQVHGYGLFLARELMDRVEYQSGPDGNIWRLTKQLEQSQGGATP